ncbi:unnamed protein product [Peronospora belbahrii]|uniref:Intimal thickness related receptor IRP domain-containing protein n=1 Tax=Peronospora belbahrii TaxID=622444 RepID=A0AAU9L2X7_9STRA|nr:unnamed protein product [Peronospora belbahrii]
MKKTTALLLTTALMLPRTFGMKQSWIFTNEKRPYFFIERFGFGPNGHMDVRVSNIEIKNTTMLESSQPLQAGLLFVHQEDIWETMALLNDVNEDDELEDSLTSPETLDRCVLNLCPDDVWINFTDIQTWHLSLSVQLMRVDHGQGNDSRVNGPLETGFYYLFYAQCPHGIDVSFHMDALFTNGDQEFLSIGDSPLPLVYLMMSVFFLSAAIIWWSCLVRHLQHVQRVHWLMAILVSVKTIALFAEAMRAYYMKRNGDTLTAWTAVTYTFMSLKGILLFSVLMLIGTGWSLLKPHLSQKDKSVLSLVLVLQVVSNVAQILEAETAVGTRAWVSWREILIVADIACCAAVLLPIVWSIRQLRVAAATDGKAFANLQKLTQFRSFYLFVICYIYMTRLVLQLLKASLPYDATWVAVAVSELAALIFFTTTGYRFRPLPLNPYLEVPMHEDDLEEFALEDDEDDLDVRSIQRSDIHKFAYGAPVKTKANCSIERQHC